MAAPKSPLAELCCGICLTDLLSADGGLELGELDSCNHRFCFPCISKWAEIENSCPFCKQRFQQLRRKRLPPRAALLGVDGGGELPGTYVDCQPVEERNQRVVFEDPQFQHWIESVACLACGGGEDEDQLLLCDECDRACHTYCAGLRDIPQGEWFCPHCAERRARRRGRHQQQRVVRRQQQPAGRRRREQEEEEVVLLSSSDVASEEEEAVVARRPAQRRRITAGAARRGGAAAGRRRGAAPSGAAAVAGDEYLSDFVVPDEAEESDWSLDNERPAARRGGRAGAAPRRTRQRAARRAAPVGGRQRRGRQVSESGSDDSTHERFGDSEPEADFTDSSSSEAEEDEAGRSSENELEERPLLARLQRGGASAGAAGSRRQPARGTRRAAARGGTGSRRGQRGAAAAADAEAPTQDHRNVNALAASWEDLRHGNTTFDAVRRTASGGTGVTTGQQQPRRRRLVRAGALDGTAGGRRAAGGSGGRGSGAAEVVDLLDSPSPAALAGRHRPTSAAAAAAAADEQQAWEAFEAAMQDGQQQQQQRRSGGIHGRRQARVDDEEEDEFEVPLAVRLSRQLAAAREHGARLVPRQQTAAAPPSTQRRTVRDMQLMAAAARGNSSPASAIRPFRIPRMMSPHAPAGASRSSGARQQPPQQQQQQRRQHPGDDGDTRNPFTRFQLGAGAGGSGSGGASGSREALRGGRSPPRHSGGAGHVENQLQQAGSSRERQHLNPDGGSPKPLFRRKPPPPPPPPLHHNHQYQQRSPWEQEAEPSPGYGASMQHASHHRRQEPQQQQALQQRSPGFAAAPSPGVTPALLPQQHHRHQHVGTSGATPYLGQSGNLRSGSSSLADFSFATARESLPPEAGSRHWLGGAASPLPLPVDFRQAPQGQQQHAQQQQVQQEAALPLHALGSGDATAAAQRHWEQREQQAQQVQQAQQRVPSKHQILDRLKPRLKRCLAEGLLTKDSYKSAAKTAVGSMFERELSSGRPFTEEEGEAAVQAAVQQVQGTVGL